MGTTHEGIKAQVSAPLEKPGNTSPSHFSRPYHVQSQSQSQSHRSRRTLPAAPRWCPHFPSPLHIQAFSECITCRVYVLMMKTVHICRKRTIKSRSPGSLFPPFTGTRMTCRGQTVARKMRSATTSTGILVSPHGTVPTSPCTRLVIGAASYLSFTPTIPHLHQALQNAALRFAKEYEYDTDIEVRGLAPMTLRSP